MNPHVHTRMHTCRMPHGFYAPQGFVKVFRYAREGAISRDKGISIFLHVQEDTKLICGSCHQSSPLVVWTKTRLRRALKGVRLPRVRGEQPSEETVRAELRRQQDQFLLLDKWIRGTYRAFIFTCPHCGHRAHLAEETAGW